MKNENSTDAGESKTKRKSSSSNTDSQSKTAASSQDTGNTGSVKERFQNISQEAQQDFGSFTQNFGGSAQELGQFVRDQLEERPYTALGVAAGLGFILGGGLTPRLMASLLSLSGRFAAGMVLKEVLKQPTMSA